MSKRNRQRSKDRRAAQSLAAQLVKKQHSRRFVLWGSIAFLALLTIAVGCFWWLEHRPTVLVMDDELRELVQLFHYQMEREDRETAEKQLGAADKALHEQLSTLADCQFVWLCQSGYPDADERMGAYIEARLLAPISVMHSLSDYARADRAAIKDWLTHLEEKSVPPLHEDDLQKLSVRYRGVVYPLTQVGIEQLNGALATAKSPCRLEADPGEGRFIFGLGRYDTVRDVWQFSTELASSPHTFAAGWTDPFTNHIVIRETDIRYSVVNLLAWARLRHAWVPTSLRRNQQSITALWDRLLEQYGVQPSATLAELMVSEAYRMVKEDFTELTLCHELGHRNAFRDAGTLHPQYRWADDNALASFTESVAALAPDGPLQHLAKLASDRTTRVAATRKFYLALCLNEIERFRADMQFLAKQASSELVTYHSMMEYTALVALGAMNDQRTIDWGRLAQRSQHSYQLLVTQLTSHVPPKYLMRRETHGKTVNPTRSAEVLKVLAARMGAGDASYLDVVMARALGLLAAHDARKLSDVEAMNAPFSLELRQEARVAEITQLVGLVALISPELNLNTAETAVKQWTYGGVPVHCSIYRALDHWRAELLLK